MAFKKIKTINREEIDESGSHRLVTPNIKKSSPSYYTDRIINILIDIRHAQKAERYTY